MSNNRDRGIATKSARRTRLVGDIMDALCGDSIFSTLNYRKKSESELKAYMHQPLQAQMMKSCAWLFPGRSEKARQAFARDALLWEGDVRTTVNHVRFLGVQHRPDFVVKLDGLRIAVEVKRGDTGSSVREGIGQALVYSGAEDFDFVTYLFVDTSKDKKIRDSMARRDEASFVASLWSNYNVMFRVV